MYCITDEKQIVEFLRLAHATKERFGWYRLLTDTVYIFMGI